MWAKVRKVATTLYRRIVSDMHWNRKTLSRLSSVIQVMRLPSSPRNSYVHNVKNVKALWEYVKCWLFVWDKFRLEKSHGNRNFRFDLLVSVWFQFFKTENEPKFGFRTSLSGTYMLTLRQTVWVEHIRHTLQHRREKKKQTTTYNGQYYWAFELL